MSKLHQNLPLFSQEPCPGPGDRLFHETLAREAGYGRIAGVDEAGRGPLAGPVVAAAVILPPEVDLPGIRDSKKMTARARENAFDLIRQQALDAAVGVVSHREIETLNILQAALEAMRRAVLGLMNAPDFLLVDGLYPVPLPLPQKCLRKGDQLSRSISAASVVAKEYRDRIMRCYHRTYPVYGFARNKGYGTRDHKAALALHGPCPLHRRTFKGVAECARPEGMEQ